MELLPEDCLTLIFQKLDCSSDRESLGLTSRRWLAIQNLNRRSLQFQCSLSFLHPSSFKHSEIITSHHLRILLSRFQHLRSLSLSGCTELTDSSLSPLKLHSSYISSLFLDCCFSISDEGFDVVSHCSSLKILSLYRCAISDSALQTIAKRCVLLTHVNLSHCGNITDAGITPLVVGNDRIKSIKLSFCSGVTFAFDTNSNTTIISPSITFIDAEACRLIPNGLTAVLNGGGIEVLNLAGVLSLFAGAGVSKIRILNLRMCKGVDDGLVREVAKGCSFLEEWNLALCNEVRYPGWEAIGAECKNLQKLHVNRCRNLCDSGLDKIREGCRKLTVLYVSKNGRLFSSASVELFRLFRPDVSVKDEELLCIGPDWIHV